MHSRDRTSSKFAQHPAVTRMFSRSKVQGQGHGEVKNYFRLAIPLYLVEGFQ